MPDGPPVRFRWRRALHEVVAAEGPERIEGVWWSDDGPGAAAWRPGASRATISASRTRAGLRFWLFRSGLYRDMAQGLAPRWFLHGMYRVTKSTMTRYIEFAAASNFSFLRGASHPEELMLQAARSGSPASGCATAIRSPASCARI